jgi:hypothetical protein
MIYAFNDTQESNDLFQYFSDLKQQKEFCAKIRNYSNSVIDRLNQ